VLIIIIIPIDIGKLIVRRQYTAHTSKDNDVNAPVPMPGSAVSIVTG
jgi:hypothetical protein